MTLNRRGFFHIVSVAIAGSASTPLLPAASINSGSARRLQRGLVTLSARALVESAMKTLGLLAPGECATACELLEGYRRLEELTNSRSRWAHEFPDVPQLIHGERARQLRWALAAELAPTYGITPERNPLVYAIGAKYGAL